jgi:hypothetical protein
MPVWSLKLAMETPFDSIESAQEYVRLLAEQVEEVRGHVADDTADAVRERATRRVQALQLADYKLKQLAAHLGGARRALNDLRLLHRLLTSEPEGVTPPVEPASDAATRAAAPGV